MMKYLFCIITAAFLFSSCSKWLELKPNDGIIREDFWKTKEDIQAAINGCYGSLLGDPNGSDKPLAEILFLWGELRADMLAPSLGTTNEEFDVMNVNTLSTNTIVNWRSIYRTINYCNTVLDFAPEVMESDKTLSQEQLNAFLAEAKALRAMMYFYLVRSFGEVPLKLTSTSSDEQIETRPKSTQAEVLAQVLKDLNEAETAAPATYGTGPTDKGRITRYTINALQADVHLWMENYELCLTACDKVINSRRFGLIGNSAAWFGTLYRNGNSNESIFEFQFDNQKLNSFYNMFAVSNRRFLAANKVMDLMYSTDPQGLQKDIRADLASVRAEDNMIWKYVGASNQVLISANDSYTHWFVYRFADILLMKAEALAQLNRGEEALELVYRIRTRATALPATDLLPDPTNKDEVTLFILDERAREFMFEGKRWYDVLRYAKRNNYEKLEYLLDMVAQIVPSNMVRTAQAKLRDKNSHYFPIYEYELQTNKNLVQNPFYK